MNRSIKILVAEDSQVVIDTIRTLLSFEKELEIIGAVQSGKQAIEFVKKERPDVVLMDIEMERKTDGLDATEEILKLYPDIKVVMLTVQEDENMILAAFEAGASDYVLKDSSAIEIIYAVRAAYDDSSVIRPVIAKKLKNEIRRVKKTKEHLHYMLNIISQLTPTEISILRHLVQGKKQIEIAEIQYVELSTIKTHISNLLRKFKVTRSSEIVRIIEETSLKDFLLNR